MGLTEARAPQTAPRRWPVMALGLLAAALILELAAGPALRPAHRADHQATVLAIPGVSGMIRDAQVDPAEITQVAARQHQPWPLALPAQALFDGLLLVSASTLARPRRRARREGGDATRRAPVAAFLASLLILPVATAVAVFAIGRLRYLVALYLSPPFGTLSYLLLYGSFLRGRSLLVLSALMALKLWAVVALVGAGPPDVASDRAVRGLAVTSVALTVVTTLGYALVSTGQASMIDALAASVAALVAVLWAGVILSGSVRRLT